ncbi:hypothetical protein VINI7043_07095 [Vibrio nigripulchritudo ATCC 27043]|uniref:hypothetical protein n=1 Tax=Vibrio nigripulchritudo TaxID=28173 RepID=UPI00021C14F2|nr:hypothetical protein [Vibrio nigripulchritudo]EGU57561.1 hypothetical protein VINI7043_07095 [Vibrio nigripulchritudo ATCC 27043]
MSKLIINPYAKVKIVEDRCSITLQEFGIKIESSNELVNMIEICNTIRDNKIIKELIESRVLIEKGSEFLSRPITVKSTYDISKNCNDSNINELFFLGLPIDFSPVKYITCKGGPDLIRKRLGILKEESNVICYKTRKVYDFSNLLIKDLGDINHSSPSENYETISKK